MAYHGGGKAVNGTANVIGAGPNGLAAAIVLAQAGWRVTVYEAEPQAGGASRTLPLTLPGFLHDFGSAVHPMAVGSPFLSSLPLARYGLEWIDPPAPLAHPLDDGTTVTLEKSLEETELALGEDGKAWRVLFEPFVGHWFELAPDLLGPITLMPRHPFLMAKVGMRGLPSAEWLTARIFRGERAKALFAGLGAHSFLGLNEPLSAAFGLMLGVLGHALGWPIPRGGAQSLANAMCAHLEALGGSVKTGSRVESIGDLPDADLTMCDLTPKQVVKVAGEKLSKGYRRRLEQWKYGPGVFKVDYALSAPIPWTASGCRRAATVHLGGTFPEIAASEYAMRHGQHAERPFVLLSQPTLFDASRAPEGKHIAWAYCHVPSGSTFDMLPRLEAQIERFAPGFRDCVLARRVFGPAALEEMDANLIGGDIGGGSVNFRQFLFRPTGRHYGTTAPNIYICSSSTPPGGGVHGMCGYNAAIRALKAMNRSAS
jgi:phytoene dehydrogenase-like protein